MTPTATACPPWCDRSHDPLTVDPDGVIGGWHQSEHATVTIAGGAHLVELTSDVDPRDGAPTPPMIAFDSVVDLMTATDARALAAALTTAADTVDRHTPTLQEGHSA